MDDKKLEKIFNRLAMTHYDPTMDKPREWEEALAAIQQHYNEKFEAAITRHTLEFAHNAPMDYRYSKIADARKEWYGGRGE